MDLVQDLLGLARDCALRTAGSMLGGMVHNLNNPTHALTMQAELLLNYLKKDLENIEKSVLQDKCDRLQRVGEDLKNQIEVLAWRNTYTSPAVELVDPVHFGTWFLQFWRNNLFFKHSMTVDMETEPPPPHVRLIPLALVWSLEEPLYVMANAFSDGQIQAEFGMRLEIQSIASHGVFFRILVSPAPGSGNFSFPSLEHGQSIRTLTQALGWNWQYSSEANMLAMRLTIPGKKPDSVEAKLA